MGETTVLICEESFSKLELVALEILSAIVANDRGARVYTEDCIEEAFKLADKFIKYAEPPFDADCG